MGTKALLLRAILKCLVAASFLFLGNPSTARGASFNACYRNVEKWEDRLHRDVRRHGFDSRQANHDRRELAGAWKSCDHRYGVGWIGHY